MRCALVTFGCKVNQYDTQVLRERLAALEYREVPAAEAAELYIVNTCAVTAESERKARRRVRHFLRANPSARVLVVGCAVRRDRSQWSKSERVTAVETISDALAFIGDAPDVHVDGITSFSGHTRAFLKVQEGCEALCSYCIVPAVRGPCRSRPLKNVLDEARRLVAAGHREIVVTGTHVGLYGRDLEDKLSLVNLLEALDTLPGLGRFRLSSIEVGEIGDDLLQFARSSRCFCPHFHVPLQSGDDDVLLRMRRQYNAAGFLHAVDRIRQRLDRPAITTDVMVGFPGETARAFENTRRVCQSAAFSRLHVFPYSARPGTPAATFTDTVPPQVIQERGESLLALARTLAMQFKSQFIGKAVRVLVEAQRDRTSGLPAGYCDRYMRCLMQGPDEWMNHLVEARAVHATPEHLVVQPAARCLCAGD